MTSWEREREQLVATTIEARDVTDPDVLRAMRAVERHRFVPPEVLEQAYRDWPLPIGFGQTISQPYVVAKMAELAGVRPGARVLDVGTGSGYQAAVFAEIGARVWSIEFLPELAARAARTLADAGYSGIQLRVGDGRLGWPEAAPFDAIVVGAAPDHVPTALLDQVGERGRLVIPVGTSERQDLVVLSRTPWGGWRRTSAGGVAFVPLV